MDVAYWSREFFESTRGQVVSLLRRGPATVEELARGLGLTPNAVRFHLRTLERDAFVRPAGVRRTDGAGKPTTVYEMVPEAEALFSQAYLPLLRALLRALGTELEREERQELLRSVAGQLVADRDIASLSFVGQPLQRAVRLLEGLGGVVDVAEDDGTTVIEGRGCPVSAIVAQHPEVCQVMCEVLGEIMGAEVHEQCSRGERPKCRFVVRTPRSPRSEAPRA